MSVFVGRLFRVFSGDQLFFSKLSYAVLVYLLFYWSSCKNAMPVIRIYAKMGFG